MRAPRNFDRTEYLVRDPSDWAGAATTFAKITDAYEFWQEDQAFEAFEFNLSEGTCRDLTDDFRDWLSEDSVAPSWARLCQMGVA